MKFSGKDIAKDQDARRKARDKKLGNVAVPEAIEERIPTVRLDAHSKQIAGMSVGDRITVTLVGNVTSLEINSWNASFGLDILSSDVKAGKNKFTELADDNDET